MSEENGATVAIETPKEIAAVAKPAPVAPRFFSHVPKDLTEAMKYAEMVAASDFVPKDYRGKPGNCLIAMQYGAELGLPPLQALQNVSVINGKPGVWGDLGKALLLSKGFRIEERDTKEIGTMKEPEALCKITRPDGQVTIRTFSKSDAVTAGIWGQNVHKTYPFRMLAWRAFWFCARDAAADVLKGIWGIEELRDYKEGAIDTTVEDAPKELSTEKEPSAEPTPSNPVVDATPPAADQPPKDGLTVDQRKHIVALMSKHKVEPKTVKQHLLAKYGIADERPTAFITQSEYPEVCRWIETGQDDLNV